MFPGGGVDMQQLLQQAQKMQQDLAAAQEELAETPVEGSAGGGLVIAYLAELHRRRASRGWNEWE